MNRELLGTVNTSHGIIKVYKPRVLDLVAMKLDESPITNSLRVCANCCNIPWEEFSEWDIEDSLLIIKLVGDSIEAFINYNSGK